jgi:hypothetical protein
VGERWARVWFAATALCVVGGVALSVNSAVHSTTGHFHDGVQRALNTFAFFTVQSNLIVGGTSLALALDTNRSSTAFRTFRLIGLVAITVTGIVYHVAIAHLLELDGLDLAGDQLVHTVVPILAVVGWLLFGPRRLTSPRVAALSLLFPVLWLGFTLVRGAVVHWYPYQFIDVTVIGYARAAVNCVWVALLLFGLAAGATAVDGRLGRTVDRAPDPIGRTGS